MPPSLHPPPPSYQFTKEEEDKEDRVNWKEVSAAIELVTRNKRDGGGGALEKVWVEGRGGGRGRHLVMVEVSTDTRTTENCTA